MYIQLLFINSSIYNLQPIIKPILVLTKHLSRKLYIYILKYMGTFDTPEQNFPLAQSHLMSCYICIRTIMKTQVSFALNVWQQDKAFRYMSTCMKRIRIACVGKNLNRIYIFHNLNYIMSFLKMTDCIF